MSEDGNSDAAAVDSCTVGAFGDCLPCGSLDTNTCGSLDTNSGPRRPAEPTRPWSNGLEKTIANEVIPRLLLAHAGEGISAGAPGRPVSPSAEDVAELTRLILLHDTSIAVAYIDAVRAQGLPIETIYLDLITPSAKLLGEMWRADLCSFTDVTVGLARLQQIVRQHAPAFESEGRLDGNPLRRAMMVAMPGEQHTLGAFLVEAFLRRAGWDVRSGPPMSSRDLMLLVRHDWFAMIGLSISADGLLRELEAVIRSIRRESRNQGVGIMVGGRVFVEHPEWVGLVGADAMARDAREAVAAADNMFGAQEGRC